MQKRKFQYQWTTPRDPIQKKLALTWVADGNQNPCHTSPDQVKKKSKKYMAETFSKPLSDTTGQTGGVKITESVARSAEIKPKEQKTLAILSRG